MRITVRSPLSVYHELVVQTDLDTLLPSDTSRLPREAQRLYSSLEAFELRRMGGSYGEIARMLDLGRATAFRIAGLAGQSRYSHG